MVNYKNIQRLLPANDNRTFGKMNWEYVTIHNTANRMPAKNEVSYVHSKQGEVTYHFAIDDKECIQLLPVTKTAWHAGDGRGSGNMKSVAIEICYSLDKGDKRYPIAEDNAAHKAAELLYSKGFGVDRLRKHQDWSGKYCPHRMLDNNGWEPFKQKVAKYMEEIKGTSKGGMTMLGNKPVAIISVVNDADITTGAMRQILSFLYPDYNPVITRSGKFDYGNIKANYIIGLGGNKGQHSGYINYFVSGRNRDETLEKAKDFRRNKEKYKV